jgi:hypothetical protein
MRKSAASARARRLSNQAEDVAEDMAGTLREAVIMVLTMAMVALIMDFPMVFLTTTLRLVLPLASRENYVRPFLHSIHISSVLPSLKHVARIHADAFISSRR